MGSLTEEELMQMVRDHNESYQSDSSSAAPNANPFSLNLQPKFLTLQDLIWKATDCEIEIHEKILKYLRDMGAVVEPDNRKNKWVVMKLNEDGYEASLCKTSWVSSFKLSEGRYEYVDVMVREKKNNNVKDGGKVTRLIVDMDFRSQFEVARPTQNYKQLKDTLPAIFVGTEAKLSKIISLLCSAAKQSLRENGLDVPPWRRASYMQSKWLSKDCKKISNQPKKMWNWVVLDYTSKPKVLCLNLLATQSFVSFEPDVLYTTL